MNENLTQIRKVILPAELFRYPDQWFPEYRLLPLENAVAFLSSGRERESLAKAATANLFTDEPSEEAYENLVKLSMFPEVFHKVFEQTLGEFEDHSRNATVALRNILINPGWKVYGLKHLRTLAGDGVLLEVVYVRDVRTPFPRVLPFTR